MLTSLPTGMRGSVTVSASGNEPIAGGRSSLMSAAGVIGVAAGLLSREALVARGCWTDGATSAQEAVASVPWAAYLVLVVVWVASLASLGAYATRFAGAGTEMYRAVVRAAVSLVAMAACVVVLLPRAVLAARHRGGRAGDARAEHRVAPDAAPGPSRSSGWPVPGCRRRSSSATPALSARWPSTSARTRASPACGWSGPASAISTTRPSPTCMPTASPCWAGSTTRSRSSNAVASRPSPWRATRT